MVIERLSADGNLKLFDKREYELARIYLYIGQLTQMKEVARSTPAPRTEFTPLLPDDAPMSYPFEMSEAATRSLQKILFSQFGEEKGITEVEELFTHSLNEMIELEEGVGRRILVND